MIKYKTEKSDVFTRGLVCSSLVDEYQLDEKTDQLVVVGKKNIQELIQSYESCALDRILEKFLITGDASLINNSGYNNQDAGFIYDATQDADLLAYAKFLDDINALKEKYNLDPALSATDTLNYIKYQASGLSDSIKANTITKEIIENEKKEIN
ncbi:hypothetical protein [Capybara microvirus Cap3_SP_562]|nr:hypothetical protein [Capybara microvirus Cap3_SP_562]